jgi:hypothetical protein
VKLKKNRDASNISDRRYSRNSIQGDKSKKNCGNSMVDSSRDNRNNGDVAVEGKPALARIPATIGVQYSSKILFWICSFMPP